MNILVTGGMGFIGSHTVVELFNSGHQPIIVDNLANSNREVLKGLKQITGQYFPFYQVDCNDTLSLDKVFQSHKIEGVIHFAAFKAVGESVEKPLLYYQNNVGSLMALLQVMEKYQCRKFIFSSSCTVYGQPDHLPVSEVSPKKPAQSPYGYTKLVCEEIIKDLCKTNSGPSGLSLRYFNPIGAHPSGHIGELPLGTPSNLVPYIIQSAAGLRGPLTIHGGDYNTPDGTCIRDYIHVVDLARAHVAGLEYLENHSAPYFDIFNLGTGNGNSVLEVVKTFEKVTRQSLAYTIGPRRSGDVEQVYGDVSKANEQLGWCTKLNLEDCLKDAWNWQLNLTND